jgi:hypothetical protein
MVSKGQDDVIATQVVHGSTETSPDSSQTTQQKSQQEREEAPIPTSHDKRLEAQPESESERRGPEADHGEVLNSEPKPPPPDALPSTLAPSHMEAMGNDYVADDREIQVSFESNYGLESPEFQFEDAHVPLDVCLL